MDHVAEGLPRVGEASPSGKGSWNTGACDFPPVKRKATASPPYVDNG